MQIDLHTRKGSFGFAVECGQRVFRRRSWRRPLRRRLPSNGQFRGFGFGPLMFWRQ
jgi:hypothetical protein